MSAPRFTHRAQAVLAACTAVVATTGVTLAATTEPVTTPRPQVVFSAPASQAPALPAPPVPVELPSAPPSAAPAPAVAPLAVRHRPDVLVTTAGVLPPEAVGELAGQSDGATAFRTGPVTIGGQPVQTVGVDPSSFRAFTAEGTAESDAVWQAVARGEAVASHDAATRLGLVLGDVLSLTPASGGAPTQVRLGALATTGLPATELVLDDATGGALGLPAGNGLLLSAPADDDVAALAGQARELAEAAQVELLTVPMSDPVAFLTGGTAAKAFGEFTYDYFDDGTIAPDAAWVRDNIVTESVPIFGQVTCHRLMIGQLRGALEEIVARGLGDTLTTYDGCYVPRFIDREPGGSVSLHTWGIAIDFDAATNYRGIRGTMDPETVAVFKRWGFRWGGDWNYTDPMHFELGALLQP